jgi:hypothetical protein
MRVIAMLAGIILSIPLILSGCSSASNAAGPVAGKANLTWTPPTTNADGSPLTDLTSYAIYRGPSASTMALLTIVPATVPAYTDTPLPVGTYYYCVAAINSVGTSSSCSESISTTIVAMATFPNPPTNLQVSI